NVAVQRETQRQRQMEFLQHTMNPVDIQITGITGRGEVLRSVAGTIGLDGSKVVPNEDELQQKQDANLQAQQQGPQQTVMQKADQGIQTGVAQGVQQITSDVTQTLLAPQVMPGAAPGGGSPQPGRPGSAAPPGASGAPGLAKMAAQGQGNQPSPPNQSPSMQTNVTGNQPAPPGPGGRSPPPAGG